MAARFSQALARARREAGFKSAYQFYHSNGGRRHFPFTYVHYLRLENAGRLPRPEWMRRVVTALRLSPGEAGCRRLFTAYLRDLLGSDEACALILEPLLSGRPAAASGDAALRWMKEEHAEHLTPAQFEAISSSEEAYWCSELLCNDGGAWSPAEAAERLGLEAADARKSFELLAKVRLARKGAGGRYRTLKAGKLYTFPGRLAGMTESLERVRGYWDKMARRRGAQVASRVELVRAEAGFIAGYVQRLAETLDAANAGAVRSKGDDTAIYAIEARVRRLLPF